MAYIGLCVPVRLTSISGTSGTSNACSNFKENGHMTELAAKIAVTFEERLTALAFCVEYQGLADLIKQGYACEANRISRLTKIEFGRTWARVDVGDSGRYMVALVDIPKKLIKRGDIVGIKGYGVPHLGYRYGSLGTDSICIDQK